MRKTPSRPWLLSGGPTLVGGAIIFIALLLRLNGTVPTIACLVAAGIGAVLFVGGHIAEQRSKRRATPPLPDAVSADNPGDDTDDGSGGSDVAVVPIEESIDLHFFAPRDVPSVVEEYLREAHARGFAEVRIIHGRGKGVQRRRVHKILEGHALVGSFRSDGLGSTVVVFRRGSRG